MNLKPIKQPTFKVIKEDDGWHVVSKDYTPVTAGDMGRGIYNCKAHPTKAAALAQKRAMPKDIFVR